MSKAQASVRGARPLSEGTIVAQMKQAILRALRASAHGICIEQALIEAAMRRGNGGARYRHKLARRAFNRLVKDGLLEQAQ